MKCCFAVLLTLLVAPAAVEAINPLTAAISLMDELTAKLEKEATAATKAAAEYAAWCKNTTTYLGFDIETGESEKVELEALIAKMTANIEATDSKIEELVASIAQDDKELKDAEAVRAKETSTFEASEAELLDSIEVLSRAFKILEREMSKNPAALLQVDTANAEAMIKSLTTIIDAAAFPGGDQKKLVALVQAQQESDAADDDLNAPAAAVYKTHSTTILDVIEDLKEKAETELSDLRKAEATALHNFEMLKQSLTDSIAAAEKRLAESKAKKASYSETKATAEGDLATTVKSLEQDKATLESTTATCAQVAADHEASMKGRAEELAAIAEAKKVLGETSGGAVEQTYSFFQVAAKSSAQLQSHAFLASKEIVTLVKKLARQHHSAALAQLASRIQTVFRFGAQAGEDPFAKVKGLISDLIEKLEAEASAEATEKAFCDEEMAKTSAKMEELTAEIEKLTTKIDQSAATSAKLKEEVKELQAELAELEKAQQEATKIRAETHADYLTAKADLELGLSGVRQAISVLRDYYGGAALLQQPEAPAVPTTWTKSTGKGNSIIDILEVVESDFAKNLAEEETEEADAAAAYEKGTQDYKLTKATKSKDVEYKEKEYKALDKAITELSGDKESVTSELDAVKEYDAKLKERCIAKPETYEERKAAREAEIAGLKEALKILEEETAFMQRSKRGHRGTFLAPGI